MFDCLATKVRKNRFQCSATAGHHVAKHPTPKDGHIGVSNKRQAIPETTNLLVNSWVDIG